MARRKGRRTMEPTHQRIAQDLPHGAIVARDVADDPYSEPGQTDKIEVVRSIRDDPLAGLWARQQIDRAQFEAGRRWQRAWERAGIGMVIAMDPTKEPVDGHGPSRVDFTDQQLAAFYDLEQAGRALGTEGNILVHMVLGQGLAIKEICRRRGEDTERYWDYWGRRLRECLETLAEFWGFASVDKTKMRLDIDGQISSAKHTRQSHG